MSLEVTMTVKIKVANAEEARMIADGTIEFIRDGVDWLSIDPEPEITMTTNQD